MLGELYLKIFVDYAQSRCNGRWLLGSSSSRVWNLFFCQISFIHFVLVEEAQMNIARHMELNLPRLHCFIPDNDGKGTVQKNVLSIFVGSWAQRTSKRTLESSLHEVVVYLPEFPPQPHRSFRLLENEGEPYKWWFNCFFSSWRSAGHSGICEPSHLFGGLVS